MEVYDDKIFPEEVDNIQGYMRDIFTTNINGFNENMLKGPSEKYIDFTNEINNYNSNKPAFGIEGI